MDPHKWHDSYYHDHFLLLSLGFFALVVFLVWLVFKFKKSKG